MRGAAAVVAAGTYPAEASVLAAGRALAGVVIPPGVDHERFRPLGADERAGNAGAGSASIRPNHSCSASRGSCRGRASTS